MTQTHLRDREFYEDIYDRHTVEDTRRGMVYYDKFFLDFKKKLPKNDTIDRPGNTLLLNVFYMQVVGNELLHRYENRENYINERLQDDLKRDEQIANARLTNEPYCQHCNNHGLRIIDKTLMHRDDHYDPDEAEEVLFMLSCPHCKKRSAFWEDGTAWKVKPTLCPKCKTEITHKTTTTKKSVIFTYTCRSCGHTSKYKMNRSIIDYTKPDPDYEEDRIHFCLEDKEFRDKLYEIKRGFERMAALGKELKEKENNKHIYDAIKEVKKPKIAELNNILSPVLDKAGYIEFSLDKPEMGRDVYIGFSCLDSRSDRSDYDSRKTLKKLVDKALLNTNWRLMSDGISYRLGYLSGRLRAYEREEDIKDLVIKTKKLKPKQESSRTDK